MNFDITKLKDAALKEISGASETRHLEEVRLRYLGRKKGILAEISKKIPKLPIEERGGLGTLIKQAHSEIEENLSKRADELADSPKGQIDLTVSGNQKTTGSLHPLTKVIREVENIFAHFGFTWEEGPEVENDEYNFQKLNIPETHPSRDIQQTYYLKDDFLLRTHTSNMQARYMERTKPPIRVLFPGRCYRRDPADASHLPSFTQIEGLMVDDKTNLADLIGMLDYFAKKFFGPASKVRVYGHNFPYTEPSIEVEVYHPKKGWLEILGAGLVHPNVLKNANIDSDKFRGWAFGVGADRLAMLKYDIDDLRTLTKNDLRFLRQF